ncbi:transcription factor HES-2.2 [Trichomycterus rosablanca]|uniref:transcription factor HES-2.2 n=1 Tax=Trichomycterus rosablanca TaxID=2290929 RepID=UPI002F35D28E
MTPSASFQPHTASTVVMRKEASELRKTLKPLLEKRRRARINDCLNRLKDLIVPLTGKDNCRFSKLEKADILEMTVRFLTEVHKTPKKDAPDAYKEGYEACLQRVTALLPCTSLDQDTSERVQDFIQQSMRSVPSCSKCSACSPRTASPIQHRSSTLQSILSRKRLDMARSEKRTGVIAPAQQAIVQNVWRPW